MSVPQGLARLDAPPGEAAEVVIGVHGFESEGYEWVQPLKVLSRSGAQVYFFRWDWTQCPDPAAERLRGAIEELLKAQPRIARVRLFGHSYGGVISALVAASWRLPIPIEVNVVAAPLAGHPRLTEHCTFKGVKPAASGARLKQWRTRKAQDGAFKDMAADPQVIELAGSDVVLLPETWQGRRLGHNWSISWVAEQLTSASP